MSDIRLLFGKNIRRIRDLLNLDQAQFGEKIGKSRSYVSQMEAGLTGFSPDSLQSLSDKLHVPFEEFLKEGEQSEKSLPLMTAVELANELKLIKTGPSVSPEKKELIDLILGLEDGQVKTLTTLIQRQLARGLGKAQNDG